MTTSNYDRRFAVDIGSRDSSCSPQVTERLSEMEFRISRIFFTLLILLPLARCEDIGTALFVGSSSHRYLRSQSPEDGFEISSMSLIEIGAAVSVLLGFVPPPTLSASSSSKLNEILMPNPFERPRAVFMLEIKGVYDLEIVNQENVLSSGVLSRKVHLDSKNADIQLPGEDEVSLVLLDEPLPDYTDEDIGEFASFIGGSYVADASKTLNGELTVPLTDADKMCLHLSKTEDREFLSSLLRLFHNVRRAIYIHEDLSQNVQSPAELISGSFNSIKALKDQYESKGVAHQRSRLLVITLSKIFHLLQEAYDGQIVGVIFFSGSSSPNAEKRLNVMFTPRMAPRWLVEEVGKNMTIQKVALVRTTLAWITGIILLIATIIGTCCLLNMPLTRDTLLYSNVKLD